MSEQVVPQAEEHAAPVESSPGSGTSAPGSGFVLAADGVRKRLTREQFEGWGALYGTAHRQLRRWIELGDAKGDPVPLDVPSEMPNWWARNMKHQVPAKILAAARANPAQKKIAVASGSAALGTSASGGIVTPPQDPINLQGLTMDEGEEVEQARQLVKAAYQRLFDAYSGVGGDVDTCQRRWEKAQKSYVDALAKEDERKKRNGEWIRRAEIQRDLYQACDMLRQMRESMARQVFEHIPGLPPEMKEQVRAAILAVRSKEDRVFQNLKSMRSLDDVSFTLSA